MLFHQFYLGCLAHASYLIGDAGEAVIVDPQRDVQQYLDAADEHGLRIRYILETHLHADFVSGHRELAERTGAEIVFGHRAGAEFPHRAVRDADELRVGALRLVAMETPGHTPEGISWLVIDESDPAAPKKVLTGDTLFIGDVGRPDLVGSKGYTAEAMAGMLYDSVHEKLMKLDDTTEVYPAHGAGSSCGRNISKERSSTIGVQRATNHALQAMTREDFVVMMTSGLAPAPAYFATDAEMNRRGARALGELRCGPMTVEDVERALANGAVLLDVRDSERFGEAHVPGSINIGLDGSFATWSGSLLRFSDPLILVAEEKARVDEASMRLARVGLENVLGYLEGGVRAWIAARRSVQQTPQLTVSELREHLQGGADRLHVVDVRAGSEYAAARVPGAHNMPLTDLERLLHSLDRGARLAIICAGGYRSSAAASLLQRAGFADLRNVVGGTSAWVKAGFATEADA